jgi:hypothetical protein
MARDVAEAEGLFCGREEVNEETSWINGLVAILKKGDV